MKRRFPATLQVAIVFIAAASLFLPENVALAATPNTAAANSSTQLLQSLYAQVQSLKEQIAALAPTSAPALTSSPATATTSTETNRDSCVPLTLTRSLSSGSTGADVVSLQEFLQSQGYYTYTSITGYFGPVTKSALTAFQAANGIEPIGAVGPITRAKIATLSRACESAGDTSQTSTPSAKAPPSAPAPATVTTTTSVIPSISLSYGGGGEGGGGGGVSTNNAPTRDTTPPSVSLTAPSASSTISGSSVTLTATASDTVGIANVQFEVDDSDIGSAITSSPYTTTWNSTSVADGSHTLCAVAEDTAGNYATSSISITVRNSPPVISAISSGTPTTTSATITWTTDEAATSQVNYGTTTSYGTASSSAALTTLHSITLTGLTAYTIYYFQIESVDGQGNTATSSAQTFTTTLTPYLGYVATRGYIAVGDNTSDKSLMSRTFHYARTNITSLQLALPNWWINGSASSEQLIAGIATTTASIEYPAGTFTRVTFGGSATGTIPASGTLVSDPVSVSIPNGAEFWVRIFLENSHGIVFTGQGDPNFGDAMTASTSIVSDQTMGGTVASTTGASIYMPAAIIGTTTQPSVFIVGDSRVYGNADQSDDASGDVGEVARAIGPNFAYVNAGASGLRTDYLIDFLNADFPSDANMFKLASYASDVINQTAVVDVILGSTTPQVENSLTTLWALFPSHIPVYQTTMPPWTTSTDGWTTLANQTPNSDDAARIGTNDFIRTTPSGLAGYFEVANLMESSQDSGLWKVPGYTTDGVHETTAANIDIENSGVFATSSFAR